MRLALYQPDIPQNTGATMRLCACLGIGLDVIEPCGFIFDDRKMKRAVMDYRAHLDLKRHISWENFLETTSDSSRIILMSTKAALPHTQFHFKKGDILLAGRESAGVPQDVHDMCENRVYIPMSGETRSLNVVTASSIILGEALRQTNGFEI